MFIPKPLKKIDQVAKNFKAKISGDWKKLRYNADRVEAKIQGEFDIEIHKVGLEGENLDPNKLASSSRKRPFMEKKIRAQQYEVAEIAKDRHPKALYRAAASKIGGDKAYVMRRMDEKPKLAKKLKKTVIAIKKKKGISLHIHKSSIYVYFVSTAIHVKLNFLVKWI